MSDEDRPLLRVVRGDPTPEELAALLVVVAGRAAGSSEDVARPRSDWNAPTRLVRTPVRPGPDGWRSSARPG